MFDRIISPPDPAAAKRQLPPEPFRIEPIFSPRIWGSRSLAPLFPQKVSLAEPIGEAWLTGAECRVATGPFAGKTFGEAWREMPAEWRGEKFREPGDFPLLVKFIFPQDKLSIQVHPDDAYAAKHEKAAGGRGKTEMWHAVSAEPGAQVLVGLKPEVDQTKFMAALEAKTLEELFVTYPVQAGDTFFLPAGTPHTIGPGMVLCEVQQYSDLTYRIYDYGRVDASGKARELHIEKALAVLNFHSREGGKSSTCVAPMGESGLAEQLVKCSYFSVHRIEARGPIYFGGMASTEFRTWVFLAGEGTVRWTYGPGAGSEGQERVLSYKPGECWFVPGGFGSFSFCPQEKTSILTAEFGRNGS